MKQPTPNNNVSLFLRNWTEPCVKKLLQRRVKLELQLTTSEIVRVHNTRVMMMIQVKFAVLFVFLSMLALSIQVTFVRLLFWFVFPEADLFSSDQAAAVAVLFVHGNFWSRRSEKERFNSELEKSEEPLLSTLSAHWVLRKLLQKTAQKTLVERFRK